MSTTILDPTVASKLQQFGRRRFRLLVMRGICAAIVTFLVGMASVALIDWYWVLTDQMRWALSGAAYLVTFSVVWVTSLRKIVHAPVREEIAAHVEEAEPELRENLLSAVELATDDPSTIHDSPVFRSLLQGKVALQMAKIRIPQLLPFRLLAKWLLSAFAIVVLVAFVLSLPDPRFRTLAARAILPGANIDRVSRIHVEILQPTPNSLTIAKDETVAIVVEVSGGDVDEVTLETFTPEGVQRQTMRARTTAEFAANVHVLADSVEYRILAGDAITRKHVITAKGRPRVVSFQKTYHYPEYSGLLQKVVTEDHGDIVVLEGTQAELLLNLDQDVSAAELRIDTTNSEEVNAVPLTRNDAGLWSAKVPVNEASIYKVHLVSSETGFENIFSPRYEIRPLPDLIPRAGFVDQQETNLLLPPNDILALQGMADDDLPLVSLEQEVFVNGLDWVSFPLDISAETAADPTASVSESRPQQRSAGHRITSAWEWDLLGLSLKTGDQVTTRLVATDRKGNRGESIPLRIVVAAPEFDPQRHANMEKKADLFDSFTNLATIAEERKISALEVIKRLREETDQPPEQQRSSEEKALDRGSIVDMAQNLEQAAAELLTKIQSVTRQMPAGADAYELDLAGRLIARLQQEHSQTPRYLLKAMQHTQDKGRVQRDLDELKQAFERVADDAMKAAFHYQQLISHNIVAAVAHDFDALLQQQTLVAKSPTQTWSRLVRQETVVINQLRVVERVLDTQRHRLTGQLLNHIDKLLEWSVQRREQLEAATESADKLPQLQGLAQSLFREFTDRQRIDVMDGGLAERLNQARREFELRSGTLSEPLTSMANATQEENRITAEAATADDSSKAAELMELAERSVAEIDLKHRHSLDQLRSRRSLTQSRQDADPQFAADAGLTHRAATSLLNQHRQVDPRESIVPAAFREIAPAWRILEAGHDMQNTQVALANLIQLERWGSQDLTGRTDHPRQWDAVHKGLENAINKLRAARVDKDIMAKFDQVHWSASVHEVNRKIGQRRWARKDMVAAGSDLIQLREELQTVAMELDPVMAEARAIIAKYAPTIPEMAEQVAQQLRQMEQQTTDAADAVEEAAQNPESPTANEDAPQLADLQQQQEQINQQIDDLFEALVEDANSQDLLDDDQRERARDADDSIAMVQEPAKQMNEALQDAEASDTPEEQAKDLAEAAEQQEKTAQALEKVAEHFDRLDKNMDVAETRSELRQHEREQGIAREIDEQFENVEELSSLAKQDPLNLLAELEAELKNNPAMQKALSEIAQNTVQEARNALQDAAQQEQEIQRANERSDPEFQAKKKELAEDIRELGKDAAELSSQLVAQANSAASQAKTPEAQQKFAQTQQKLNEAANAANSANEGELQADLAEKLQQARQALQAAAETLKAGKDQSAAAKNEEIHADEKNRQNAKKNLETQRKRFNDQRKKTADAEVKRRDGEEQRAKVQTKNAENNFKAVERQVQQAEKNLARKPDDANLKNAVAQAEARKQQAQQKVDNAKEKQQEALQNKTEARDQRNALNSVPEPPLNDKNPAAQLAEAFATEAEQAAAELAQQAEELAKNANFGEELTPAQNQLAVAANQQQQVTENVQQTADDVARAARHERRLENSAAATALNKTSEKVQQVANNEATTAKQKLDTAAQQAAEAAAAEKPNPNNQPALAANDAVEQSEQAISAQAEQLTDILKPLQDAQAAAAAAASEPSAQQPGTPQPGDPPPQGSQPAEGAQSADAARPGSPPSGSAAQNPSSPNGAPPLTADELAIGQLLAQTLDELDRHQAAQQPSGQQLSPSQLPSLAQAAQARQAKMAAARSLAQQQAALASSTGEQSESIPAYDGETEEFAVLPINRSEDEDWGKLREKAAEDLTKGRSESVSAEYRKSVETYFRVLAERARRNK